MVKDRDACSPWGGKESDTTEQLNNKTGKKKTPGFLALPTTAHPTSSPTANPMGSALRTHPEADILTPPSVQATCPSPGRVQGPLLTAIPASPSPLVKQQPEGWWQNEIQLPSLLCPTCSSEFSLLRNLTLLAELRRKTSPLSSSHIPFLSVGRVSHAGLPAGSLPVQGLCYWHSPAWNSLDHIPLQLLLSRFKLWAQLLRETCMASRHACLALPTAFLLDSSTPTLISITTCDLLLVSLGHSLYCQPPALECEFPGQGVPADLLYLFPAVISS